MSNPIYGDISSVTVSNIGTTGIDGNTYRTIILEKDTLSPYALSGTYIERFGKLNNDSEHTQHFFIFSSLDIENCEQGTVVDWCSINFDCYYDNIFNLNPNGGCGYSLGINEINDDTFSIYPNPASTNVKIHLKKYSKIDYLKITNSFGEFIFEKHVNSSDINIDITILLVGVYYITIYTEGKKSILKNFVKN